MRRRSRKEVAWWVDAIMTVYVLILSLVVYTRLSLNDRSVDTYEDNLRYLAAAALA